MIDFSEYVSARVTRINNFLQDILPKEDQLPTKLHQAMRYAVLSGGKRIRPLLVYVSGEMFATDLAKLDSVAAAIELIHCYSLVHDDLPAIDNDTMRRGKPTCHVAYGEAAAILAGNSLYNLALQTTLADKHYTQAKKVVLTNTLLNANWPNGMLSGEALELEMAGQKLNTAQIEQIHNLKTGSLIKGALTLGAIAADANPTQIKILDQYGQLLGLAFQIQDDILDNDTGEQSYTSLFGLDAAKDHLEELQRQMAILQTQLEVKTTLLVALTDHIMQRKH